MFPICRGFGLEKAFNLIFFSVLWRIVFCHSMEPDLSHYVEECEQQNRNPLVYFGLDFQPASRTLNLLRRNPLRFEKEWWRFNLLWDWTFPMQEIKRILLFQFHRLALSTFAIFDSKSFSIVGEKIGKTISTSDELFHPKDQIKSFEWKSQFAKSKLLQKNFMILLSAVYHSGGKIVAVKSPRWALISFREFHHCHCTFGNKLHFQAKLNKKFLCSTGRICSS